MSVTRLSELRKELCLNKKQASELFNIPYTTYVNYENETREPNLEMLKTFSQKFGVSVDYFLNLTDQKNANPKLFDFKEEQLLKTYRMLSDSGKSMVFRMIYELSDYENRSEGMQEETKKLQNIRTIPLYSLPVSAGTGQFLEGDNYDLVEFTKDIPNAADFGLRISGDSMEPLFHNGDTVWVKKESTVENGQIGIFLLNGSAYLKRLKQIKGETMLVSLNPKYSPIKVMEYDEFSCVGRVMKS